MDIIVLFSRFMGSDFYYYHLGLYGLLLILKPFFVFYWSFSHLNCPFIIFSFGVAITFSLTFFFLLGKNFELWKVATVQRTRINAVSTCQHFTTLALSFFSGYVCALVHTLLNYSKGAVYVYDPSPHNILVYSIKTSMFFYVTPV